MGDRPVRVAQEKDVSRIAEILIFAKRVNYRDIFHDDRVSFGEMQVLPLAEALLSNAALLSRYWVYEEDFVKGLIHIEGKTVEELYVDPFFAGQGIGGRLIEFAVEKMGADNLWVLEKNLRAIAFYSGHGFMLTGERRPEEGTEEHIVRMVRNEAVPACLEGSRR